MKNFNSLKKNNDFLKVYQTRRSYANNLLVMYVLKKEDDEISRVGISVSKKVGNSVIRHRFARIIRECFRLTEKEYKYPADIVVVARVKAAGKGYKEINEAYINLCKKHGLI